MHLNLTLSLEIAVIILLIWVAVLIQLRQNKYLKRIKTPFDNRFKTYNIKKDGEFVDFVGSLNISIKKLYFEKNEIISFLKDNIDWFKQEKIWLLFFLHENKNKILFVMFVCVVLVR